jgi:methionyl-tRNA formyltransferase
MSGVAPFGASPSGSAGHGAAGVPPQRLVVMATGPFAVPMLDALVASPHEIAAVVTRPDRVAPGRRPPANPVRAAATAAGLAVLAPESANAPAFLAILRSLRADLLVVCDYGQILSAETLATARLGGVNLHGSLLPRHRGAAPVQWAILEGDRETGACVIRMTASLDAGRVIESRATAIGPRETAAELEPRLAALGAPLVPAAIARLATTADPDGVGVPQDPAVVTRAPRLSKADALVDWSLDAGRIDRRRRAFEPWPRIHTFLPQAGEAALRLVLIDTEPGSPPPGAVGSPGTILAADDSGLVVACGGETALWITKVLPEGRRSMTAAEFLRGRLLLPGTRLADHG